MIELSFDNVNNTLSKAIDIQTYCVNSQQCDYVFRRAVEIYIPKKETFGYFCKHKVFLLEIKYVSLQLRSWKSSHRESWNGFRGVLMIHPDLSTKFTKQQDFDLYDEMAFHNQRYLDLWQS